MAAAFDNPLDEYLYEGEGERLEFKQTLNSEYKIARTLSAFANTRGGVILIGIKDDRTITGIDVDEERHIIEQAAGFWTSPVIQIKIEEIYLFPHNDEDKEKAILKVTVAESRQKPHFAIGKNGIKQAYLRQNDKTLMAGDRALALMKTHQTNDQPALSPNERRLISYLRLEEKITLKKYMALVNVSRRRARRELNDALEKGIIRILEHEKEPYYTL